MSTENSSAKMFNIGSILKDPSKIKKATHKVPVLFDDEGNPYAGFIIVGPNSDEYTDHTKAVRVENISRGAQTDKPIDPSTPEGATIVVDKLFSNEVSTAVAVVVGWYGFCNDDGQEAEFNKDEAEKLIRALPVWKNRIQAALNNDVNFMKL